MLPNNAKRAMKSKEKYVMCVTQQVCCVENPSFNQLQIIHETTSGSYVYIMSLTHNCPLFILAYSLFDPFICISSLLTLSLFQAQRLRVTPFDLYKRKQKHNYHEDTLFCVFWYVERVDQSIKRWFYVFYKLSQLAPFLFLENVLYPNWIKIMTHMCHDPKSESVAD